MLLNLKTAIAARGWRQVDFGLDQKIPPTVLSEIIHERRKPTAAVRVQIAVALHADEDWLFSSITCIPRPAGCGGLGPRTVRT